MSDGREMDRFRFADHPTGRRPCVIGGGVADTRSRILDPRSYKRIVNRPVATSAAPQTKLKLNQVLRKSARPNLR
jgi:hypothetical protein